jgi:hypothetical protein
MIFWVNEILVARKEKLEKRTPLLLNGWGLEDLTIGFAAGKLLYQIIALPNSFLLKKKMKN